MEHETNYNVNKSYYSLHLTQNCLYNTIHAIEDCLMGPINKR